MKTLQEKLNYTFQNVGLLEHALTHSSYANEHREGGLASNERLEFLGDSVLGLVVADHLFRTRPDLPEGDLTRIRAALVCEGSLVEVARSLGLGAYLKLGKGMVILKDGKIVSGASSYSRYLQGIEIEVDTVESERRKHLATAACSALILECLNEGLYPSWDAQNMHSVHMAEKLGYEFDHAYTAYEVAAEARTH